MGCSGILLCRVFYQWLVLIGYGTKDQVKDRGGIYFISLVIALASYLLTLLSLPAYIILILQLLVLGSLFIVTYRVLKQPEYMEIENFCKSKIISK